MSNRTSHLDFYTLSECSLLLDRQSRDIEQIFDPYFAVHGWISATARATPLAEHWEKCPVYASGIVRTLETTSASYGESEPGRLSHLCRRYSGQFSVTENVINDLCAKLTFGDENVGGPPEESYQEVLSEEEVKALESRDLYYVVVNYPEEREKKCLFLRADIDKWALESGIIDYEERKRVLIKDSLIDLAEPEHTLPKAKSDHSTRSDPLRRILQEFLARFPEGSIDEAWEFVLKDPAFDEGISCIKFEYANKNAAEVSRDNFTKRLRRLRRRQKT